MRQLTVGPFFTCFPVVVDLGTKFVTGINLLTSYIGLFRSEESRVRLAFHGSREAVVRTMTSLGVMRASATRLAAFDRTFGDGAAAHRLGVDEIGCELPNTGRDGRRGRSGHAFILRHVQP